MNIVKATKQYEDWLGLHIRIVEPDLQFKHEQMAAALFPFFRATFYRWLQVWPEECAELDRVPHILSVGDLHVENVGTWRDTDGRLVWGVNDFDEACVYPYTMDLVRLATSALLATRENRLAMKPKGSATAILAGYEQGMEEGGTGKPGSGEAGGDRGLEGRASGAGSEGAVAIGFAVSGSGAGAGRDS